MKKWKVHVNLEATFNDIEAETEEEAFVCASDFAMSGGGIWDWECEEVEEGEENE